MFGKHLLTDGSKNMKIMLRDKSQNSNYSFGVRDELLWEVTCRGFSDSSNFLIWGLGPGSRVILF